MFHLNTDLEKLWKNPSKSKFKAKVCALSFLLYFITKTIVFQSSLFM